jgi:UDP-N-acetylmuramyl pentapeptide phosphotransferase/UDP-N-acetylglucosamine-1-phosphate transferase
MPEPEEQASEHDRWEIVLTCLLLGTGLLGLILAVVGMTTNRDWLAIVGYVLAAPLISLVPVLVVLAQVSAWRQQRRRPGADTKP